MISLLVTGGCGFIGSNFINHIFDETKYKIVNLDAMYYCAAETNIQEHIRGHKTHYKFIKGNLCAEDLVRYVIETHEITHVIHFAAQSHVQNSFEDSIQFTHDNILGTHTLLEVCKRYGKIQKFIHVSTDEVYGESMLNDGEKDKKTEQSILCPTNPYAATKAGAELIAQSYYHSFQFPVIITRGNNVYGPNQYPEKLIPKFIQQLTRNQPVTIQGDGSCVRAFLHASDTAKAFELILTKGEIGEIYNIGCHKGMEYSVLEVAQLLIKKIKKIENDDEINKWIEYVKDRPFNDTRYYISNQKLVDLGWTIETSFETGLEKLIIT
jgi:dTDP-glucose 4,6-dehydratase